MLQVGELPDPDPGPGEVRALEVPTGDPLPLAEVAAAHDRVDTVHRGRTLIQLGV